MAIDHKNKRRSILGYDEDVMLPIADGTIGAGDRAHVAGLYSGLPLADRRNLRRSILGYDEDVMLPVADRTIGVADRMHVAQLHSGLALADLRYWGAAFNVSAAVPFNQALANISIVEFRDLLRSEHLLADDNQSQAAWTEAVRVEVEDHRQQGRTLADYRPHGLLTVLLLPHGGESLLIEPAAEGALERMIARIRAIFENDRSKLLTTACLASIVAREGFVATAGGAHTTYSLAWRTPSSASDARTSASGRLIPFPTFGWFDADPDTMLGKADYVDPTEMKAIVNSTTAPHPQGAALYLSVWNHVRYTYQTIVFSDDAIGTVRLTFNGQTTGDINAAWPVATVAANHDDLRRKVLEELSGLSNIQGKVSVFAVDDAPRTLRVMFFLDRSTNGFDNSAAPASNGYFPETTFENFLVVGKFNWTSGNVTVSRGIDHDFFGDFTDSEGAPYVDSTGKSIAAIWSNNVLDYLETFVDAWCARYIELGGRMDAVFFDHENQNHYFKILTGIYFGGITSPSTDVDGHAAVFAKLADQDEFDEWAALLPESLAEEFGDWPNWSGDANVNEEYVRIASLKMAATYIQRILDVIKARFDDPDPEVNHYVVSSDYAMCGTNLATPTHLLRTGYVLGDGASVNQRHDYPLYISNAYYVHALGDVDPLVVPEVSKDRSWIPNAWSIVKAVSRDSSGTVKVELYNQTEIAASNYRRGNGQFLSGFYLGQRISINTVGRDDYHADLDQILPNIEDRESKRFPVIEINNSSSDPYIKYLDDRTTPVSRIDLSGISSSGGNQVFIHSLSEWQMFLQGIRITRGALATNPFPLSMWYEWDKELNIAQFKDTKLRPSLMLHAALMGEYNTPFRKYYAKSSGSVIYHDTTPDNSAEWTATHDSADET